MNTLYLLVVLGLVTASPPRYFKRMPAIAEDVEYDHGLDTTTTTESPSSTSVHSSGGLHPVDDYTIDQNLDEVLGVVHEIVDTIKTGFEGAVRSTVLGIRHRTARAVCSRIFGYSLTAADVRRIDEIMDNPEWIPRCIQLVHASLTSNTTATPP